MFLNSNQPRLIEKKSLILIVDKFHLEITFRIFKFLIINGQLYRIIWLYLAIWLVSKNKMWDCIVVGWMGLWRTVHT